MSLDILYYFGFVATIYPSSSALDMLSLKDLFRGFVLATT